MGTKELTLLDIQVAPFWEVLYMYRWGKMSGVYQKLDLRNNAPRLLAYITRFRRHPAIMPYRLNSRVVVNYWLRAQDFPLGVKCEFSTADYKGVISTTTDNVFANKDLLPLSALCDPDFTEGKD